jgi:pimeloyl-ACP methyl ester carboxylesterase
LRGAPGHKGATLHSAGSHIERLHVLEEGEGPPLLLVHGSAVDHGTWSIQRAGLRGRLRLLLYDRRGTGRSPLPEGRTYLTVEEHAQDAARLIQARAAGGPLVACGSSYGAVVVLELARRWPGLLRGAVLLEPPLPPADDVPAMPVGFVERFDRAVAEAGGSAGAELFLRHVLGDEGFERMPRLHQQRALAHWEPIRHDCEALPRYHVDYPSLARVRTPVLLLGGDRSPPRFRQTLEALRASLGDARLEVLAGAGHMVHAEAHRRFATRLLAFMGEVGALR